MTAMPRQIQAIYRYPVKGLSPEPLPRTELRRGRPCRATGCMPSRTARPASTRPSPDYLPKQRFLMLMRNARLAELRTRSTRRATR